MSYAREGECEYCSFALVRFYSEIGNLIKFLVTKMCGVGFLGVRVVLHVGIVVY